MKRLVLVTGVVAILMSGCDTVRPEDVPDCVQENVAQADTCSPGVVACQAVGGSPRETVWYCKLHLVAADGLPYEAVCVPSCPAS